MNQDLWMSQFYEMNWFKIDNIQEIELIKGPCIIEYIINANDYKSIDLAQKMGFRLVETAVEFETVIDKLYPTKETIRKATENDLFVILDITEKCYLKHDKFYNRFKNKDFFTEVQAADYYRLSVQNNFNNPNTITVVTEDKDGVCAYYMIKKVEDLNTMSKFKGIISGVLPRAKGQNLHIEMQHKVTALIGVPYTTVNRTQLGNYRVIGNHIKEQRQLSKIEHIFYLKKEL